MSAVLSPNSSSSEEEASLDVEYSLDDELTLEEAKDIRESLFNLIRPAVLLSGGFWFATSIVLTIYNKFLFGAHNPQGDAFMFFHPLLTTASHAFIHFTLTSIVLCGVGEWIQAWYRYSTQFLSFRSYRKLEDNDITLQDIGSRGASVESLGGGVDQAPKPNLIPEFNWVSLPPLKFYFTHSVPCAVATALDVGLSNMSMKYVTVSLYTMFKSSAPIFVLLVSFMLGLEKVQWRLVLVIMIMCVGVMLMMQKDKPTTADEGKTYWDSILGSIMCLCAALMAGFRIGLSQLLLQKDHHTASGVERSDIDSARPHYNRHLYTMFQLSPIMCLLMFIFSLFLEHPFDNHNLKSGDPGVHEKQSEFIHLIMMFSGGFIAFFMILAEFWLISITSALVLSVGGILKEILTIVIGVVWLKDKLTAINVLGLIISMIGIVYFNYIKHSQ